MKRHAWTALLCLLTACEGPNVRVAELPSIVPASNWREDTLTSQTIEKDWWQLFGDPALTNLVERVLKFNTEIEASAARVRDARAQERLAKAQLMPTLDFSAPGGRLRGVNAFGQPEEQSAVQPEFLASYEIDLFGRLTDQASAGRSGYLASRAARDTIALSAASAAASGYVTLLALDARLAVAKKTLVSRREALRIANSRARSGYSPMFELHQAKAEFEATAQIVSQIELAISRQENALSQLAGNVPNAIVRGKEFMALIEPPIPGGLPSDLLRRRPDIAQAENQLAAVDATLSASRKRFLPQFKLTGTAGVAVSSLLLDPIAIWSIGGSILAPLFEGGRLDAQLESAAAQRDLAAATYRRVTLNAFREVEDNLASIRRFSEQARFHDAQRDALEAALKDASNRYRAGYAPYLEQLDAQRGLLNANLSVIQTRAEKLTALIALYQALGGGWHPELP